MHGVVEKLKSVFEWQEFKIVWVVFALLAAAFIVAAFYVPPAIAAIEAVLILAAGAVLFFGAYTLIRRDKEGAVGKGELKSIIFNLQDGIIFYDKNFKALFFNPVAEKLFKIKSADVLGHEFQPQDVEKEGWRILAQVMFPSLAPTVVSRSAAGEYPQILDVSFSDPILELRVLTLPVKDAASATIGFMKVIRDRTREVTLMKSKNEFLTVASHQLRTPVTDIMWAIESLAADAEITPASKKTIDHALEASRGLIDIVEDLLNVARIEEGHFGYAFEAMDIVAFIGEILKKIAPLAERSGMKVYFDAPKTSLPKPFIDKQKLSLALSNILENAVRYNTENGEVTVGIEKVFDKPFIEISVKDTGIGMTEEEIGNLFKKFYRSPSAMKTHTNGSGLGLYIAKNIIQAHGGQVWVESEQSRGSIFHLTLPTEPKLIPQHEVVMEE
ncbi:MAG: ATP-binding protein [Patescibacteria group bacterium]